VEDPGDDLNVVAKITYRRMRWEGVFNGEVTVVAYLKALS